MTKHSVGGVSTSYERKNRRVDVPAINVTFQDATYQTLDWGLGGFRIDDFKTPMKKDEEFTLDGIGPADEGEVLAVRIPCRAMRRNGFMLSCSFTALSSEAYDILEALMLRRKKFLEKLRRAQIETNP